MAALLGCSDGPLQPARPTPTPPPTPPSPPLGVSLGPGTGATQILFSSSQPPPGTTFSGCGPDVSGCEGRLRLRFLLRPSGSGPALNFRVFLHDTSLRACLLSSSGPFELRAGDEVALDLVLDQSDRCATPTRIATMAAIVEGTVEISARQEWGLSYTFRP